MNSDFLIPLATFAFVTSITPGPNNLMLMASGANFGFVRTIPHMLGVALGFVFLAVVVGMGLAEVFSRWPVLHRVLDTVSVIYLVWLAWRIANAGRPSAGSASDRPMSFFEAAVFQWVNPKAWAMALTAVTVYAPGNGWTSMLVVAAVFGAINLPTVSSWCILGVRMSAFLRSDLRLRLFNRTMAVMLIASLYPMIA